MSNELFSRRGLSRRSFLRASGAVAAAVGVGGGTWLWNISDRSIPGSIQGASAAVGHLLREGKIPAPSREEQVGVAIIGGGISGLSAAWMLDRSGYPDFRLLELEREVGGNSASGKNSISAYPWAAHYIPIPGEGARAVHELFRELGVIEGYDRQSGLPIYNEYFLCSDPQERLWIHGRWQEGLIPQTGISADDRRQYDEFFGEMKKLKQARGSDGRPAFSIPIDSSSRDRQFTGFDSISMARYMDERGWSSRFLRWYVNYCCRDDYGTTLEETSAWAALHYFASRTGKGANTDGNSVLTWPEGNGWVVSKLRKKLDEYIRTGALVYNVEQVAGRVAVDYFVPARKESVRLWAKSAIFAAPRFVGGYVVRELRELRPKYLSSFDYAPWMVANVTVASVPEGRGAPLSWDNVSFHSESLGYIVSTHQDLTIHRSETVLSYYLPLTGLSPRESRKRAHATSHAQWAGRIADDLEKMNPGIRDQIRNIDVWVWGHGMIRPVPGFIWGGDRREALRSLGRIHFAHSDMSGISIFEEAQYRGVSAAQDALRSLGIRYRGLA